MHLGSVSRGVLMDIGEISVIQHVLWTVKNRLVMEVLDIVSPVSPDFGETPVHYCVHHFVTREFVAKTMVPVHRDARQGGMGWSVIEYAALDVNMIRVINRVGYVSMDANRTGQGTIATVSIILKHYNDNLVDL